MIIINGGGGKLPPQTKIKTMIMNKITNPEGKFKEEKARNYKIYTLHLRGLSYNQISRIYDISKSRVEQIIKYVKEKNNE